MKQLILILTFMVLTTLTATAQSNSVTGFVMDNNQDPLIGVIVSIPNLSIGGQTDDNGQFKINNVPTGAHTFELSYVGFKTKEILFTVSENQVNDLGSVTLFEGNELIQLVTVSAERENKFSRKETAYVSKLPLKDRENPVVYTTVTNELLQSQVVTDFDAAMTNATGVSKLWEATGRSPGEGTSYFSIRGFATQPALVDGMPGFTFSAIDPSYIERIEVIKGPNATLFGSTVTSLGGLINVVTKKPYQGFGGNVSYTAGSFGLHRASADVNTPIGKGDNVFFRLNASYLTQNSFQDAGFRQTFFVAPSLSYRVNNRLNLSLGVEYSRTEQTNPSMLFMRRGLPLASNNVEELGVDPNRSFTSDDVTLTSPILNTRVVGDYKITDNWTSQTIFASTHSEADGYYQFLFDGATAAFGVLEPLADFPGVGDILLESQALLQQDAFTRIFDRRNGTGDKYNVQQNFIGDFRIGKMRNRLVFGLDYVNRSTRTENQSGNNTLVQLPTFANLLVSLQGLEDLMFVPEGSTATLAAQLNGFPYFDGVFSADGTVIPNSFTPDATYSPTLEQLDAAFAEVPATIIETGSQTFATYISDVLNITDYLTVHLGLRLDIFDQEGNKADPLDDFTKTTFSPTAGIVYQPLPDRLTVFTNYQTGFINNNPVVNPDGTVQNFGPTGARQFEGGVKTNFLQGKLNIGLSYYHITVDDLLGSDPRQPLFPQSILLNETISQGLEVEFNLNPVVGLNIRAGYAYNDKTITDAFSSTTEIQYDELQDRRPEDAGPQHLYNLWADYRFIWSDNAFLKNLGIGAGLNGASEHLTINNAISGQFALPSYTVYNATIYYDADRFRVGFKVNNLSDEVYYNGWSTVNAQAPRAYLGTASFKF
ncbi:MAG: TonB-dependent receptor [Bacteroidota bacterium]